MARRAAATGQRRGAAKLSLNPSGRTRPIWYRSGTVPQKRPLRASIRTEVCIVGAGIAGLTTAYLLATSGKKVVVLDEKPIGGGETGRTSAHLASALDDRFTRLIRLHGVKTTRLHYQSHAAAIDLIERIAREEALDCDFARLDGYLFLPEGRPDSLLQKELAAARRVGVAGVQMLDRTPAGGKIQRPCLRFPAQARFHPLKYLAGLARVLERQGVRIFCGQRMMDLAGNGPVKAKLRGGLVVTADAGVSATNVPTPINNWVAIYTKQAPYRTYVIGVQIPDGAVSDALYWDFADPYHYVRLVSEPNRTVLLVGGEDHKTGQPSGPPARPFKLLEDWTRALFPAAGRVVSRWSGQVNEPGDGMAYIGRVPTRQHKACFVITGDSGMGLTHGTLGAMLVSDLILGRPNPWQAIYDPRRRALRAPGEFLKENVNAAAQLRDYLTPGQEPSVRDIPRGRGAVIRQGLSKLAVYRDDGGKLHKRSAVCPHLQCVVRWNGVENSWDCPCHGSRFDARGGLIMGPSIDDLRPA
jgi:glycine/D-amino acid oxidase-like deaminating enzyme/nitrite reductase/ring-hydroxylating ferredoxin subunit